MRLFLARARFFYTAQVRQILAPCHVQEEPSRSRAGVQAIQQPPAAIRLGPGHVDDGNTSHAEATPPPQQQQQHEQVERVAAAPALAPTMGNNKRATTSSSRLATGSSSNKNFLISRQLRFCDGRQQHTDFCTAPRENNESFTCCGPDLSIYTFPF